MIDLVAESHVPLGNHIAQAKNNAKYLSPMVQNELIEICGNKILNHLVPEGKKSEFFSVLADEATDSSNTEQMSLCVRFIGNSVEGPHVREEFVGFVDTKDTSGEILAKNISDKLNEIGLNIHKVRGQGYDGAANMSGKCKGVQTRIREIVSKAYYVHCNAHCLNLVLGSSCTGVPAVRNMIGTVQEIGIVFDYSAKRLVAYKASLNNCPDTLEVMGRKRKLKILCKTRWATRATSLSTLKDSFQVTLDALETLGQGGDSKAASLAASMSKFDFIVALVIAEHFLLKTSRLSLLLQSKTLDLPSAVKEAGVILDLFKAAREDHWNNLYQVAKDLAIKVSVEPKMPRHVLNQQSRPNHSVGGNTSEYFRVSLFLHFLDHLISEMNIRFMSVKPRSQFQYLMPGKLSQLTTTLIQEICEELGDDRNEESDLSCEVERWRQLWGNVATASQPTDLEGVLKATNQHLYPNIWTCLQLLLVLPVSTATVERTFSSMRLLKTYLRSIMSSGRLTYLALMFINKDYSYDRNLIINEWASRKPRRLQLAFDQ